MFDRLEVVLADGLGIDFGDDFVDGLARERIGAVRLLEDLARHFPLAKAGQPHVLREPAKGTLFGLGELLDR